MEHYFSLYGIIEELAKLWYGVLHLDQERWKWWQWRKNSHQGYVALTHFVEEIYELFDTDSNHLGHLTKLKNLAHWTTLYLLLSNWFFVQRASLMLFF
jgi:hypothetical protein